MPAERPIYLEQAYQYRVKLIAALEAAQEFVATSLMADIDTTNRFEREFNDRYSFKRLTLAIANVHIHMTLIMEHSLPPDQDLLYLEAELYNSMCHCGVPEYTARGVFNITIENGVQTTLAAAPGSIQPSFEDIVARGKRWILKSKD